jgi:hypothetical protein
LLCWVWQPLPQQPFTVPCVATEAVAHAQPPVFGAALLHEAKPAPHVYPHVVPLQLTAVEFVALQTFPQAAQLLVVFSVVHVLPHWVSRHLQAPFWQSGLGCAHVAWFVHVPAALQVCGVVPVHCVCEGAHTPEQTPATHVSFLLEHDTGVPQVPLAVHV